MHHSLKILGPVEVLLLLEKVNVGDHWDSPSSLAVSRIWERNSLVAREVSAVVSSFAQLFHASQFGCGQRRAIIRALEEGGELFGPGINPHRPHSFSQCL
jgi:hypothetical protein